MIDKIKKYDRSGTQQFAFSLLIPTWNNIEMFRFCLQSLKKNSTLNIQPVIIVNEGTDGTIEWLLSETEYDIVYAKENIGICYALNTARSLIKSDYIAYLNDDMYVLPGWDTNLMKEIESINSKNFMLSSTMIEPHKTGNKCVVVKNFGQEVSGFREQDLLTEYKILKRADWMGSTWPPNIVHVDMWDIVGGLSTEFHPGMYSDPDFALKLYNAGVRYFKGVGDSMVYHFGSKSTKRVKKNKGRKTFLLKWGFTANVFTSKILKSGQPFTGPVGEFNLSRFEILLNRLKRILNS